jgi:hypothetical protein
MKEDHECSECKGYGYNIGYSHHPNCDGSCHMCPVPIQVPCEYCETTGKIKEKSINRIMI